MYPLCVFCNHAVSWLPLKTKQQHSSFYFQFYFQLKFVPHPRKCGYSSNTQLYRLTSVWRSTVCLSLCPKFVRGAVKVPYFHTVTQYLSLLVRFTLVWGQLVKTPVSRGNLNQTLPFPYVWRTKKRAWEQSYFPPRLSRVERENESPEVELGWEEKESLVKDDFALRLYLHEQRKRTSLPPVLPWKKLPTICKQRFHH